MEVLIPGKRIFSLVRRDRTSMLGFPFLSNASDLGRGRLAMVFLPLIHRRASYQTLSVALKRFLWLLRRRCKMGGEFEESGCSLLKLPDRGYQESPSSRVLSS